MICFIVVVFTPVVNVVTVEEPSSADTCNCIEKDTAQ